MTTDALGPCPPETHALTPADLACVKVVGVTNPAYADWQRRRAERAEELLREGASYWTRPPASPVCPCDTCEAKRTWPTRVAAHFDSINTKGDDK